MDEKKAIPCQSQEQLRDIAEGIVKNKIFTDRHVDPHERDNLHMIFMPIALGAFAEVDMSDIGMIYAYYEDASPRGVNGMPMFFACNLLNREDTRLVVALVKEMEKALNGVKT